ncbi:MAG: SH3 domain-containing protein [Bacteroidales bacterium]|nr:SH3 domain-containing protein [Bacteroidales bacterium]
MKDNNDITGAYHEDEENKTSAYKDVDDDKTSAYTSESISENNLKRTIAHGLAIGEDITLKEKTYRLLDVISEGTGEAIIYKIADKKKQIFALKLYYEFRNSNEEPNHETLNRIKNLNNSDILKLHDFGAGADKFQGKFCYEISAFACGGDLLSVSHFKEKYTSVFIENQLVNEIFKGIKELHKLKIYHCDLKPSNIFYTDASQINIVIGDYGSAKAYDLDSEKDVRKSSIVKGTEAYISPEQARGVVTGKNDYYALGMILLHLLYPESLTDGINFKKIQQLKINKIVERQTKRIPIIDFNDQYKRLNALIEGLTLYDFTLRWGKDEIEKWLKNEDIKVVYNSNLESNARPIKLGSTSIKDENDFITFIEANENFYEILIEDQDTYRTVKQWMDEYYDIPTRKKIDQIIRFYEPLGKTYIKEALLRYFDLKRPLIIDMKIYDFFNTTSPVETLNLYISHIDDIYKITEISQLKFLFFQLEFSLRQIHVQTNDKTTKALFMAMLEKLMSPFGIVLSDFNYKTQLHELIEQNKSNILYKQLLDLFYVFNTNRVFRDFNNNNISEMKELALFFVKDKALNDILIAEKNKFLSILKKEHLIDFDINDLIFEILKGETVAEMKLVDITFDRSKNFKITYNYYKSLNPFLNKNKIDAELTSESSSNMIFKYQKKFFQTYAYVFRLFLIKSCEYHKIASLTEKNKSEMKRAYRKSVCKQYRKMYGAQYIAFILFLLFATLLTGIFTKTINISHGWELNLGHIKNLFKTHNNQTEAPVNELLAPTINYYKVTANSVHLRKEPSKSSKSLGKVNKNEMVGVLDTTNSDWYYVHVNGLNAYIFSKFLIKDN